MRTAVAGRQRSVTNQAADCHIDRWVNFYLNSMLTSGTVRTLKQREFRHSGYSWSEGSLAEGSITLAGQYIPFGTKPSHRQIEHNGFACLDFFGFAPTSSTEIQSFPQALSARCHNQYDSPDEGGSPEG
jgi:hypothetical protein